MARRDVASPAASQIVAVASNTRPSDSLGGVSLTQLGVILLAVLLIVIGAGTEVTNTLILIVGVVVVVLVLFDSPFVQAYRTRA